MTKEEFIKVLKEAEFEYVEDKKYMAWLGDSCLIFSSFNEETVNMRIIPNMFKYSEDKEKIFPEISVTYAEAVKHIITALTELRYDNE